MTARSPEDPIEADPMLRVLRERHPDVDVVVLPGQAVPDPQHTATATASDLDRLAHETEGLVDALVSRLTRHAAWPVEVQRESRWRVDRVAGASGLAHREAILVAGGLADGDNVALLRATGNALLGLGWQARPVAGAAPRLVARRGAFSAAALVREASLQVVVSSGHVLTGTEDLP